MTTVERFWAKVERTPGCWPWTASGVRGYGRFWDGNRTVLAYRYSWALTGRPDHGLSLDHACNNKSCVNPDHLRPMPIKDNILLGGGPSAINARRTTCRNGHPFDKVHKAGRYKRRICGACRRAYYRARARLKKP